MGYDDDFAETVALIREWPTRLMLLIYDDLDEKFTNLSDAYLCDDCCRIYTRHGIQGVVYERVPLEKGVFKWNLERLCWICTSRRKALYVQQKLVAMFDENPGLDIGAVLGARPSIPSGELPGQYL